MNDLSYRASSLVKTVHLDGLPRTPWKNGGGVTRELAYSGRAGGPASASGFSWRLSIADIDRPGPFSAFDGYHRKLVLLDGTGLELDFQCGVATRLDRSGDMQAFDGGDAVVARLHAGPCRVVNVMTAHDARCDWTVRLVRDASLEIPGAFVLLPVLGCWRAGNRSAADFTPGTAALRLNADRVDAVDLVEFVEFDDAADAGDAGKAADARDATDALDTIYAADIRIPAYAGELPPVSCTGTGLAILLRFHSYMPGTKYPPIPRSHP